jgi:hypothetical protein
LLNNVEPPEPSPRITTCKCTSNREWYYYEQFDTLHDWETWINVTPTPDVDIELYANWNNGCPSETPGTYGCYANNGGFDQSEECYGIPSRILRQYLMVKSVSGELIPATSYEINISVRQYIGSGISSQLISEMTIEGCAEQVNVGSNIHCSGIYSTTTLEGMYHYIVNPNGNIKITMKPDALADYILRVSTLPNLFPFVEPPETNRFYICYADKNKQPDGTQTCELNNLSPGKYYIFVYHVRDPKTRYGYTLEVKRVSQTSTTTSTIGQSGGGGGGRMPYMMDLINTLREFISRVFKI